MVMFDGQMDGFFLVLKRIDRFFFVFFFHGVGGIVIVRICFVNFAILQQSREIMAADDVDTSDSSTPETNNYRLSLV